MAADTDQQPLTAHMEDTVSAKIDALIIGRPLQHPLYDSKGVLLLGEGAKITPGFKRTLKARQGGSIRLHPDDAAAMTLSEDVVRNSSALRFDTQLTKQLDEIIDSGLIAVKNDGPAVCNSMVFHGKKGYDPEQREILFQKQSQASESLDKLMRTAIDGGEIEGPDVANIAAACLTDMTADNDNALTAVFDGENHKLADHAMQMAMLGMAIGIEMGLDAENIRTIGVAGLVCDWGMTRLPKRIRDSETILTEVEFFEIKKHPLYTLEILEKMSGIPRLVPMVVYQIHERPNGTGYPSGRCEGGIHQFSSILHIADAYTSLITEKPYRRALMPYAAMECLIKQARTKDVDAEIVRTLLHVLSLFPIGSFVSLSNGSVARVLRRNGHKYTSPILEIVQDADGMKPDGPAENAVLDPSETGINIVQAIPTPGRHEVSLTEEILDLRQ